MNMCNKVLIHPCFAIKILPRKKHTSTKICKKKISRCYTNNTKCFATFWNSNVNKSIFCNIHFVANNKKTLHLVCAFATKYIQFWHKFEARMQHPKAEGNTCSKWPKKLQHLTSTFTTKLIRGCYKFISLMQHPKTEENTCSRQPKNLATSRVYFHNKTHTCLLHFEDTYATSKNPRKHNL